MFTIKFAFFANVLLRNKCCFCRRIRLQWFSNSSTSSVKKKMDESCAGGKEIENSSIASNQGPNHDDGEQVNWEVRPVGGYTCAVPLCTANSKTDKHLKFYRFPDGKLKEKQELRKKWINLISRKGLNNPTESHRVCFQHFVGGVKTYINNLLLIVPKATRPTIAKESTRLHQK